MSKGKKTAKIKIKPDTPNSIWNTGSDRWKKVVKKHRELLIHLKYNRILFVTVTLNSKKIKTKAPNKALKFTQEKRIIADFKKRLRSAGFKIKGSFYVLEFQLKTQLPHFHILFVCPSVKAVNKLHERIADYWKLGTIKSTPIESHEKYLGLVFGYNNEEYGYLFKHCGEQIELPIEIQHDKNCTKIQRYSSINGYKSALPVDIRKELDKKSTPSIASKRRPHGKRRANRTYSQVNLDAAKSVKATLVNTDGKYLGYHLANIDLPLRKIKKRLDGNFETSFGNSILISPEQYKELRRAKPKKN